MEIQILKKIGSGVNGSTFMCKYNGSTVVAKIEKFNGDLSFNNTFARQLRFNEFAKKHSNRFTTLLFAGVVNNCIFKQPTPANINKWEPNARKTWLEHQKNDKCCLLIYTPLLNCTLSAITYYLSKVKGDAAFEIKKKKLMYDIFRYLKKTVELMNAAGYQHGDIHDNNIMYKSTNTKTNNELIKKIKTLNINPENFYIIDYGSVYSTKFALELPDIQVHAYYPDLYSLIWDLADNPVATYAAHNNIATVSYKDSLHFLQKHEIYGTLTQYLPLHIKKNIKLLDKVGYLQLICVFVDYNVYCAAVRLTEIQTMLNLVNYKVDKRQIFLSLIKTLKPPLLYGHEEE